MNSRLIFVFLCTCVAGRVYCTPESSCQGTHRRLESQIWADARQKVWV